MPNDSEIQIGDNLAFVAKDQFISSTYSVMAFTVEDDDDISRTDGFFNSKEFVHAFRADTLKEAVDMANKYILKLQKQRTANLGQIHTDAPSKMHNPSGFNSYVVDTRKDEIIQAVPQ